jgi:serine/threonine protein kinase
VQLERRAIVRARSGESYRVVDFLGHGGNANVYLVETVSGVHRGVLFALKLFREINDEPRLGRFRREAAFLLTCDHPAVMHVYDGGEVTDDAADGTKTYPYMVVEYIPKTLEVAFRAGLTLVEKIACALQLLSGLQYLSSLRPQVVHRDIKPQNIFLRGRACVLGDFGLMKLIGEPEVRDIEYLVESTGPRLPRYYRSPDLVSYCRGEAELTVQSDIFQLGLVLARLFTGSSPLRPCKRLLSNVRLSEFEVQHGSLSTPIKGILDRMLVFDPGQRPSVAELLELWEGPFIQAVDMSHDLQGCIF